MFWLLVGLPFAAPVVQWVACLWLAERKAAEAVAAARAGGEPALAEDFRVDRRLAAGANAAPVLRAAEMASRISPAQDLLSTNLLNDIPTAGQDAAVRQLLASNRRTLDLSREARHIGDVDWSVFHPKYVGSFAGAGAFYSWRPQSLLLYDAAWLAHADGDDASAVEFMRDLLFIQRAMADYPVMNSHVWAGFTGMMAVKRVEQTARAMKVGDPAIGAARSFRAA